MIGDIIIHLNPIHCFLNIFILANMQNLHLDEYEWKNNLRLVRIYFDTKTFDRITKDRAAKFATILSGIGGTLGLFTGFSIFGGIEILYYISKIFLHFIKCTMLKISPKSKS